MNLRPMIEKLRRAVAAITSSPAFRKLIELLKKTSAVIRLHKRPIYAPVKRIPAVTWPRVGSLKAALGRFKPVPG